MIIGAVAAVVILLAFAAARLARSGDEGETSERARDALADFAAQSLELDSVEQVLGHAGDTVRALFGAPHTVAFVAGVEPGSWEAWAPERNELIEVVPAAQRGLFAWFKHNSATTLRSELGEARLGAMRQPLATVMDRFGVDVIVPLVHEREMIGALGFPLGRRPSAGDRALIRKLRIETTAACANVRLHREASYVISLAQEVDLAKAAQQTLVPEAFEGQTGGVAWAGHFEPVGDAGSDFWAAYPLAKGRVLVAIGDATGHGLAGSMVSAVVKSCSDAIVEARGENAEPGELLEMLNRTLWRGDARGVHMSCFAAIIDRPRGRVDYASAGHPMPYVVAPGGALTVLKGRGAVLGDMLDARFVARSQPLAAGSAIVFFTDGVPGARSAGRKPFGERRLQKLLAGLAGASAAELRAAVVGAVAHHRAAAPREDDEALLVVTA